jgi:hypothetical protein
MKQRVYITNPEQFLRGDTKTCFKLFSEDYNDEWIPETWFHCADVEFEPDVDFAAITAATISAIDDKVKEETAEHAARMHILEQRKAELLALPAPDDNQTWPGQFGRGSES